MDLHCAQQADYIAKRQEETGAWFLEDPILVTWLQGPNQPLFCPGIPGTGKTMIAAISIDHLTRTMRTQNVGIAFIYCNYDDESNVTGTGLLASILKQLVLGTGLPSNVVGDLYRGHSGPSTTLTLKEVCSALVSVLSMYARSYVVFDALDECRDDLGARTQLVRPLCRLQEQSNLSIMITSRFILDIEIELHPCRHLRSGQGNPMYGIS
jgi:Cdc6-like AAA superfamily ATPase